MPPAELRVDRHEFRFAGAQISVLVAGAAGALPPVLAVHGFGSSADGSWQRTGHLTALVRAGRQVIAPDLLGHGRSDKPTDPGAYSLAGLTELAVAALTEITGGAAEAPAVDLLGYSLGARICWEILASPAHSGPTPRRAVLGGFDGRALFDGVDGPALLAALGELALGDLALGDLALGDLALGELQGRTEQDRTGQGGQSPTIDGSETSATQGLSPATQRIVDIIRSGPDVRRDALLALVQGMSGSPAIAGEPVIPVLFAAGDRDPLATGAEQCAARLPAAEFVPIPRRDHISAVPAGVFRAATVKFLGH